jgi:hypothetical protein
MNRHDAEREVVGKTVAAVLWDADGLFGLMLTDGSVGPDAAVFLYRSADGKIGLASEAHPTLTVDDWTRLARAAARINVPVPVRDTTDRAAAVHSAPKRRVKQSPSALTKSKAELRDAGRSPRRRADQRPRR